MSAHIGNWSHYVIYLIPYVIADPARFRRFILLVLLTSLVALGWRLFADGGLEGILHAIQAASVNGHPPG